MLIILYIIVNYAGDKSLISEINVLREDYRVYLSLAEALQV